MLQIYGEGITSAIIIMIYYLPLLIYSSYITSTYTNNTVYAILCIVVHLILYYITPSRHTI